jgi:hypothetical protein
MRLPFAAAATGFALAEAVTAAIVAKRAGLSFADSGAAALGAFSVVLLFGVLVLWPIDALLRTRGAMALGTGLHRAVAAEGSVAFAWLWSLGFVGAGAGAVLWLLPSATEHLSPRFGAALGVLSSLACSALLVLAAAASGHPLGRRFSPQSERGRSLDRALAPLAAGAALSLAAWHLVEPRYAPAIALAAMLTSAALLGTWRSRRLSRASLVAALAAFAVVSALERLPKTAAAVLAYRTTYAALVLGLGQRLVDRDGDGASPILLGGDCDDLRPDVHPRARDVPQNGIDENCNGSDAPLYEPPRPSKVTAVAEPHDLVVLLLDALRPDRLSLSGYARKTSPNIDALAREGAWFQRAYTTAPSTRFAMASLFTGRDVRRLRHRDTGGNNFVLEAGAPTVARRLRKARYRSVGYTVSYVVQHNKGTGQGFHHWGTPWPIGDWRKVGGEKARLTSDAVLEELARTPSEQRLFLFAHYDCTHTPYRKYPTYDFGDRPSDLYDSGLAHCDAQIGRVLAALRERPT